MALETLFTIMDATIFDRLRTNTIWAGRHEWRAEATNFTSLSLHLGNYRFAGSKETIVIIAKTRDEVVSKVAIRLMGAVRYYCNVQ